MISFNSIVNFTTILKIRVSICFAYDGRRDVDLRLVSCSTRMCHEGRTIASQFRNAMQNSFLFFSQIRVVAKCSIVIAKKISFFHKSGRLQNAPTCEKKFDTHGSALYSLRCGVRKFLICV